MIKNILITAIRNLKSNKLYALINIFGLTIGLAACLVVYVLFRHEMGFDDFHPKKDQIYRIVQHWTGDEGYDDMGILPNPMAMELAGEEHYPKSMIAVSTPSEFLVEYDHLERHETFQQSCRFANENFLTHLNFPVIRGAGPKALGEPFNVFLTEEIATKYFGGEDAIGKSLTIEEQPGFKVVGILEDIPNTTNFPFEILISYNSLEKLLGNNNNNWGSWGIGMGYMLVPEGTDLSNMEKLITEFAHSHFPEYLQERLSYHLQPLKDVHTDPRYQYGSNYTTPSLLINAFVILAIVTLLASVLNFINLSTAQSVKRAKEIGVRKTLGSTKSRIVFQFMGETLIITICALAFALILGKYLLVGINEMLSFYDIEVQYGNTVIAFSVLLVVLVTVIGGFYPSFILANYNPINAIQSKITLRKGSGNAFIRRLMVTVQFVIVNILVIVIIIINSQMGYIREKDMGFQRESIVSITFPDKVNSKMPTILNEYRKLSFVENASWSGSTPIDASERKTTNYSIDQSLEENQLYTEVKYIDPEYIKLFNIPLLYGRNLDTGVISDTTSGVLVSRELLRQAGFPVDSAVGKKCFVAGTSRSIIGVVEDFHIEGLQEKIGPVLLDYDPLQMNDIILKLSSPDLARFRPEIERVFRSFSPTGYFEPTLLSDEITSQYQFEDMTQRTCQVFAVLSILIGILGLYGLISFMAETNRRAISIRKVFGASVANVILMFSKEYLLIMITAFMIAAPIAYLAASRWLEGFAYRVKIEPVYFLLAFAVSFGVMAVTICRKSYQVATENPIKALKHE